MCYRDITALSAFFQSVACLLISFVTFIINLGETNIFTILYSYPREHCSIYSGIALSPLVS